MTRGGDPSELVRITVTNEAAVTVSVTSHFHFFETNPRLRFDRRAAYGRRLDVPAGAVVRFEPGTPTEVVLVPFGGHRVVVGFAGLVDGPLDAPGALDAALDLLRACGFADTGSPVAGPTPDAAVARRISVLRGREHGTSSGPDGGGS